MKTPVRLAFLFLMPTLCFTTAAWAQSTNLHDVGQVSFANSGSPAAQASFLHGLAQLHNFEFDSAADDFKHAQAIDPGFAMAYWGEAMSYNHPVWFQQDTAAGRATLERLAPKLDGRLAKAGTERERDYLRAVDILYFADGTKDERDLKYCDAMAALHQKYPDDVDGAALYALSILGTAHHGRDFAIYMRSLAVLEPLFWAHPEHPGVAHYLIHSVDDPIHAPLGLAAARSYSKIALIAPHAQHMTSHIFVAMGMWDDVVQANEIAVRVQNEQNAKKSIAPAVCAHYNFWLEYGYLQQGRTSDAKQVLEKCRDAALVSANSAGAAGGKGPDQGAIGYYAQMRSRFLLDSQDWNGDVSHWTVPAAADAASHFTFAFADGFAAVRRNDLKAAREALTAATAAGNGMGARVGPGGAPDTAYTQRITVLEEQLQAIIEAAEGNRDGAIALLRKATATETAMPLEYGPPFIEKPTGELLGEILLEAKRPSEARAAFQDALSRAPNRTESLMGVERASKDAGDNIVAAETDAKLRGIWHRADHVPEELR